MQRKDISNNKDSRAFSKRKTLLAINAILVFVIAFQIGGKLAAAQTKFFDEPESGTVKYFDEPTSNTPTPVVTAEKVTSFQAKKNTTSYKVDSSSPYTAQFPEYKDQLSSTISPENPGPNKEVTISVAVYSFDINSAIITWKKDGQIVSQGVGQKSFTFKTGLSGVTTKIDVAIDPRDRPIISDTYTFTPSEVDLLWQTDTYTPPFYKGKGLYTPESSVKLVALPRSASGTINPESTVFNWTENYNRKADLSGYGKNTYSFTGPILIRPTKIRVETHSPKAGDVNIKEVASTEVDLTPSNSGILFYEDNPALGVMFNKSLTGTVTLNKPDIKVAAYPYFQSIFNKNAGVEYSWVIDGFRVEIGKEQNSIILNKTDGESGNSTVQVQAKNPKRILQTNVSGINITFDTKSNTFGTTSGTGSAFGN